MSDIVLPSKLTQQPQWAAPLNPGNSIVLDAAIILNATGGGLSERNLVTGYNCAGSGTALGRTVGLEGRAYSAGGNQLVTTDFNFNVGAGDFTIAVVARSNANNTADAYMVVNPSASNAGLRVSNGGIGTWTWSTAGVILDSGIAFNPAKPQRIVFARRSGINYFCVDGVLVNLGANTDTFASGNVSLFARNNSATTLPFFGDLYLFVGSRRSWSDVEMRSWCANPWQLFAAPPRRLWLAASSGGATTAALSGLSATGSAGNITPSSTLAASGQSSTTSQGALTAAPTIGLSGQSATGTAGSVLASTTVATTGQSATNSPGSVSASQPGTAALIGQSATSSVGTLASLRTVGVTGQSATSQAGNLTLGIIVPLSGQTVTSAQGSVTGSTSGNRTAAITGQSLSLSQGIVIGPQNYPQEYYATIMRQTTTNVVGGTLKNSQAVQGGTMKASQPVATIMRASTTNTAATMRQTTINVIGTFL